MSIAYNGDGSITLTANYSARTQTIPAGTDQATANADIEAFFTTDTPPPTTRADVLATFSQLTGYSVADMTAFFAGTLT